MYQKIVLILIFTTSIFKYSAAQIAEKFIAEADGKLLFQTVTASGTWLIGSEKSLSAHNPENGAQLWNIPSLAGIQEQQVSELPGSSLLMITKNSDVVFVDPFSGEIRFNTADHGIKALNYQNLMFKSNSLLIAGSKEADKPILMMVNLASGKVKWSLEEKFGKIITANEFDKNEMLLVTLFHVYRLSSADGKIIWKETTSETADGMAQAGALGNLFADFTEQLAANVEFNLRYYENKEKDVFLIGSEVEKKRTTSDGKTSIAYFNNYSAFKLSSGKRLWTDPVEMKGKFGVVVFNQSDVLILPDDGNKTIINAFDINSGAGKWGKKGKGISMKGGVYDTYITDKGILVISGSGSNSFLNFLNPETGEFNYDKSVKANGRIQQLIPAGNNFAFITTDEMNIINPTTGDLMISKSIPTTPNLAVKDGNTIIVADPKKGSIKRVDLATNAVEDIFAAGVKFGGKESPQQLEIRAEGFLLTSDQNIALISKSGEIKFNQHFPAPRESGLKRALLYAQAARAAYIGANAYYAAGVLQSAAPDVAQRDAVGGAMVEGIGQVYQNIGEQAEDFVKKSLQQASARAKATTQSRDFMLVLSDTGKEFALLKVNKNTGVVDGEISLGKDKEPKYAVDDVSGLVFRQIAENKISGYQL
jgi:outer membrane protein assembly factor BamB